MFFQRPIHKAISSALLIVILVTSLSCAQTLPLGTIQTGMASDAATVTSSYYLPSVMNTYPWHNPLGVEATVTLAQGSAVLTRMDELQPGWVRLNERISWRKLQPKEGDLIQWSLLADFENELRALKSAGITPVVIIDDYPYWAVDIVRDDNQPASCGPLNAGKFAAFAQFVGQIVSHFRQPAFDVHHWELGNEPDVDANLLEDPNSPFGCWGRIGDPYYGGGQYGEMLKVVTPAIRAADPGATIWLGGLLLASPNTTDPYIGHPEHFLKGILEAGAAPHFDIVPYHWYPSYTKTKKDYDLSNGSDWESLGSGTVAKANYLRQLLASYGVSKPISLNETGLGCPHDWTVLAWCVPPEWPNYQAHFYDIQATYLVRSYIRGVQAGVSSFIWYTINGPGWRYTGLLDENQNPKPVYSTYQTLATQLKNTRVYGTADYGAEIEAYAFRRKNQLVHVLWAINDVSLSVQVAESKYIAAYNRDGTLVNLDPLNGVYTIPVGFDPVYIVRYP